MNELSWFLYLSDVVSNLDILLTVAFVVCGIALLGLLAAVPASDGVVLEWKDFGLWRNRMFIGVIATGLVWSMIPSKNTMYAIAASQIGERMAKNPDVTGLASDATKALRQWIQKQLDQPKKKDE